MLALVAILVASCPEACCVVDPSADRTIDGYAHFPKRASFEGSIELGPGIRTGLQCEAGITTPTVAPMLSDQSLRLFGRKRGGDVQPGVIITAEHYVDSGTVLAVMPGGPCQGTPIFSVSNYEVGYGATVDQSCQSSQDKMAGSLVDQSSMSEHVSYRSLPGLFLTIGGGLSERRDMVEPNGADPEWNPMRTRRRADNSVCYEYAGMHGDVALGSVYGPRTAGYLVEFWNPLTGTRADHRAFIDWNGAYAQNHQLRLDLFPSPVVDSRGTSLGTSYYGAIESTLMFDFAPGAKHWYFANGTEWRRLAEQPTVDEMQSLVVALTARVAALEAVCP